MALPVDLKVDQTYTLNLRAEGSTSRGDPLLCIKVLQLEIEEDLRENLWVPDKLTNPDKLIIAARESFSQKKSYTQFSGTINTTDSNLDIRVTPGNVGRSLRFMDTFIKCLRLRGHEILTGYRDTYVMVQGVKTNVALRERTRREMVMGRHFESAVYHPTGKLYFKVDRYGGGEYIDGKTKIEGQISRILAKLEMEAIRLNKTWAENRKREDKEKEIERLRLELSARKQNELDRFKKLIQEARRWREVKMLREYLAGRVEKAQENNMDSDEFIQWSEWVRKKIDWYDPAINAEDDLLAGVDKDNIIE